MIMGDGKTPGTGRDNPFGDGAGSATKASTTMPDFTRTPGGTPTGGATPRDLTRESRPQSPAPVRTNAADAAPAGPLPAVVPPPNRAGGVGSAGNAAKPYKLGG
jgi:hypothetical protein